MSRYNYTEKISLVLKDLFGNCSFICCFTSFAFSRLFHRTLHLIFTHNRTKLWIPIYTEFETTKELVNVKSGALFGFHRYSFMAVDDISLLFLWSMQFFKAVVFPIGSFERDINYHARN